jgi:hypothetical protein
MTTCLRGTRAWSWWPPHGKLDVRKVVSLSVRQRLFTIFQKELPWTLQIVYAEPYSHLGAAPVLGWGGVAVTTETELTRTVTARYATRELADEDAEDIARAKAAVEELLQSAVDDSRRKRRDGQ